MTLECLSRHQDRNHRFLDGRTLESLVGLAPRTSSPFDAELAELNEEYTRAGIRRLVFVVEGAAGEWRGGADTADEGGLEQEEKMAPTVSELMKEYYDQQLKGANYLFVAHGAGLVGCLSVLKDYGATPQLKGIGVFVVLFGVGFIGAILTYISLVLRGIVAAGEILDQTAKNKQAVTFLMWTHLIGLSIALLTLLIAIFLLIGRFGSL